MGIFGLKSGGLGVQGCCFPGFAFGLETSLGPLPSSLEAKFRFDLLKFLHHQEYNPELFHLYPSTESAPGMGS